MIRVLVLADVPGWAWGRKAAAYRRYLGSEFEVTVAFHAHVPPLHDFDLVHLFEVSQIGITTGYGKARPFKLIAGLTANVWRTWGAEQMFAWAAQVDALHANSLLLHTELKQFHPKTYYTPNGVDAEFWCRTAMRAPSLGTLGGPIVLGHVGKPNPRKGAHLIIDAAQMAGLELRLVQRTAKVAYGPEIMRDWYQGIHVQVTASNMDGTPNPMLEAAACENALLSTPIGNMPELITDKIGYLTHETLPYHGPSPMASDTLTSANKQIIRLRDELATQMEWFKTHPDATIEMGRAARQVILDGWTWEIQTGHVAQMWREVLG